MLRFVLWSVKAVILLAIVGAGMSLYAVYYYSKDLPDYSQLKEYHPPSVTRIYSSDGKLIEEYAKEHRIFVPIDNIPKSLIEAFVAAEDKNFYDHQGIDLMSIFRAAITNVNHIINNRKIEGGSTITQQVVKNFLLTSERSFERKIKEAILSYMMSQAFTKEQILELYLNQIYLGKGAYGVAAASLRYFNKSVEELSLNESAVLASLPKAPSKFNPEKNYERVLQRKNYVLGRMYDDGYITEDVARYNMSLPISLVKEDKIEHVVADHYADQVREEIISMYGSEYFYTAGLTVITCLDSKIQKHAKASLVKGIVEYDKKLGYRGPITKISTKFWQKDLHSISKSSSVRQNLLAVVLDAKNNQAKIGMINGQTYFLHLQDTKWAKTNLRSLGELLTPGDVIIVHKTDGNKYLLAQTPEVNGAIIVMDHSTGKVLAMEGGYDYLSSKFNRATQAKRQSGSLLKTFVYLAALENGAKPNDIFDDSPVEIALGYGLPNWKPKNYNGDFLGPMTLRQGLEKSRNTITVRLSQTIGLKKIIETIKRFGISENPPKVPSIVLGALETTLENMTNAYGIIANKGKKISPHYIEVIKDRKGNVIYKRDYSECRECKILHVNDNNEYLPPTLPVAQSLNITDVETSYQITSILKGSVERGTSKKAQVLGKIIAGKTGTTNDSMDVWFIGYTPHIVVGTYVGYDNPRSLGKKATGATVTLPIFIDFMASAYKNTTSIDFEIPDGIKLIPLDYRTGKISNSPTAIMEAFKINNLIPGADFPVDIDVKKDIMIPKPSQKNQDIKKEGEEDPIVKTAPPLDSSQEIY